MKNLHKTSISNHEIEEKIFELLSCRKEGASICPSEVARALHENALSWRDDMTRVRVVAEELSRQKRLVVTRGNIVVKATDGGGPIRLRLPMKQPE